MAPYRRLVYEIPAALDEIWSARLVLAGTLGLRSLDETPVDPWADPSDADKGGDAPAAAEPVLLEAYFDPTVEPPMPGDGVRLLEDEILEPEDWMSAWRASVEPLEVGRRFLVDPREVDEAPPAVPSGRCWLRLPARQAFGTGSHETTRLVLEMMEDLPLDGARVLDVGTGSGILSFAALHLGAACVTAFDIDVAAAVAARQNIGYNAHLPALARPDALDLYAGTLEALAPTRGFTVALVNVLPERLRPHLDALAPCLAPGARALVSGVLDEARDRVLKALAERGFECLEERRQGEWVGLLCRLRDDPRRAPIGQA